MTDASEESWSSKTHMFNQFIACVTLLAGVVCALVSGYILLLGIGFGIIMPAAAPSASKSPIGLLVLAEQLFEREPIMLVAVGLGITSLILVVASARSLMQDSSSYDQYPANGESRNFATGPSMPTQSRGHGT